MLNKVSTQAQLKQALIQRGFVVFSMDFYPHLRNTMFKCWDLSIGYEGTVYNLEADTVQGLLDEVEEQLL